jgi:hypothetical protein
MNNEFCPICYRKLLEKGIQVDPERTVFRCKVPIFSIDGRGDYIVKVWDCEKQEYKTISQEEFLKIKEMQK